MLYRDLVLPKLLNLLLKLLIVVGFVEVKSVVVEAIDCCWC